MSLGRAIAQLHDAERDLAAEFVKIADRHAAEHDVHHTAHTLARQAEAHAEELVAFADRHGAHVSDSDTPELWETFVAKLRRTSAELMGRSSAAGALLLRDLRRLYLSVSETEISWWIVRQGALAARDGELAELFERCHEETWQQLRWVKTKIKESSAQVLVGG